MVNHRRDDPTPMWAYVLLGLVFTAIYVWGLVMYALWAMGS